jgi:hypothetical protein
MHRQLEKKLKEYIKKDYDLLINYRDGKMEFKQFLEKKCYIYERIKAILELQNKNIAEKELTDSQISIFINEKQQK